MNRNEIDIATYLTRLESSGDPVNNILAMSLDLAEEIRAVLGKEEKLKIMKSQFSRYPLF
jgi:hypothetical protein